MSFLEIEVGIKAPDSPNKAIQKHFADVLPESPANRIVRGRALRQFPGTRK